MSKRDITRITGTVLFGLGLMLLPQERDFIFTPRDLSPLTPMVDTGAWLIPGVILTGAGVLIFLLSWCFFDQL